MTAHFHQYLFNQITQSAQPETLLAEELVALLRQSKANIYKKIQGKVPFTFDEIAAIARHYNISIDRFVHNGTGDFQKVVFDYSFPEERQVNTPVSFLEKIRSDLEQIVRLPHPQIVYASNEIPLFHSLECRSLTAFKLYVWSRTNWKLPEHTTSMFDPDAFYDQWPELEEHRQAILALYAQIPSKEYWSRTLLSNMLHQIQYYVESDLFVNKSIPGALCREMQEMVESRNQIAALGIKKAGNNGEKKAPFILYLNEIAYTNNIILIYTGGYPVTAYATMDNPNFIRSIDPAFCARMHAWVHQIEECSFLTTNEQHRLSLFRGLKKEIEDMAV